MRSAVKRVLPGGVLLLAFVIWQVTAALSSMPFFPPLSDVLANFSDPSVTQTLLYHLEVSLYRVAVGYILALVLSIPLGLLAGWLPLLRSSLEPLVDAIRSVPSTAYIPLAILFLGIGDNSKIFLVWLASSLVLYVNVVYGIYSVDPVTISVFKSFNAKGKDIFSKLLVPYSFPSIISGMRISVSIALIVEVAAEIVFSSNGLGWFLVTSEQTFHYQTLFDIILVLSAVGYAINRAMVYVERRTLSYRMI